MGDKGDSWLVFFGIILIAFAIFMAVSNSFSKKVVLSPEDPTLIEGNFMEPVIDDNIYLTQPSGGITETGHNIIWSAANHDEATSQSWRGRHVYSWSLDGHDINLSQSWRNRNHNYDWTKSGHMIELSAKHDWALTFRWDSIRHSVPSSWRFYQADKDY